MSRARGRFAFAGRGQAALQAGPGPLEGAVDRVDRRVDQVGHLVGVVSEDVAEDEHGALAGGQDLQRGHEGQGDGLRLFVACLRAERRGDRPFEQGVRIGLEPHDLAEPGRFGRFDLGDGPLLGRASAGRAQRVETPVGGDPVQPRADRGPSLEPGEALPGGEQRVLEGVLGVLDRSEHPVAVHLELSTVRLGQLSERGAVPGPRPSDELGRHRSTSRHLFALVVHLQYRHRPSRELGAGGAPRSPPSWCLHSSMARKRARKRPPIEGDRDGAREQDRGDLRRRRGDRRRGGACVRGCGRPRPRRRAIDGPAREGGE